ncbi:MAG: sigma-54-dependent transcriptional regulator [Desulfopila sp.]
MSTILIIDDDQQLGQSFAKILRQDGYRADVAFTGREGIAAVTEHSPDLVILDICLPDINGLQVFNTIHRQLPKLPVIIITAYGTTETAIGAIREGAFDYIYKPFDVPEMLSLIDKALLVGRCMRLPVEVNPAAASFADREALVGSSATMLAVYKAIGRVSPTEATVLIRGESGTGKELAARAIYNHSRRSEKPFVVVNCVAIPETLLESELFGYEKGSFTGASHRRVGKVEQGRGGTIFLDEIGDMPLSIQAKLLRLLQENHIERLGGREPIDVDVRIIAATNRDLEAAVAAGTFREDLYYRLRVVTITMPPLRERLEDLEELVAYLLARLSAEMHIANPGFDPTALARIRLHDWPGNIRELANILKKALIFNRGAPLLPEDISIPATSALSAGSDSEDSLAGVRNWLRGQLRSAGQERLFDACLDTVGALLLEEALSITGGNRSQAARLLGISRPTLHARLDKYNLKPSADGS